MQIQKHEGVANVETVADDDSATRNTRAQVDAARMMLDGARYHKTPEKDDFRKRKFGHLAATEVLQDDLNEYLREIAEGAPSNIVATPGFRTIVDTMRIEHDGTSFYIHSESEQLTYYASKQLSVRTDMLLVLQEETEELMNGEEPYFYLQVFVEDGGEVKMIGKRIIVKDQEEVRRGICAHIINELISLTVNGIPHI
jgi:hypothetical protein